MDFLSFEKFFSSLFAHCSLIRWNFFPEFFCVQVEWMIYEHNTITCYLVIYASQTLCSSTCACKKNRPNNISHISTVSLFSSSDKTFILFFLCIFSKRLLLLYLVFCSFLNHKKKCHSSSSRKSSPYTANSYIKH